MVGPRYAEVPVKIADSGIFIGFYPSLITSYPQAFLDKKFSRRVVIRTLRLRRQSDAQASVKAG